MVAVARWEGGHNNNMSYVGMGAGGSSGVLWMVWCDSVMCVRGRWSVMCGSVIMAGILPP